MIDIFFDEFINDLAFGVGRFVHFSHNGGDYIMVGEW